MSFGSWYARFSGLCCFGEVAVVKSWEDVAVANMQLSGLCLFAFRTSLVKKSKKNN